MNGLAPEVKLNPFYLQESNHLIPTPSPIQSSSLSCGSAAIKQARLRSTLNTRSDPYGSSPPPPQPTTTIPHYNSHNHTQCLVSSERSSLRLSVRSIGIHSSSFSTDGRSIHQAIANEKNLTARPMAPFYAAGTTPFLSMCPGYINCVVG